MPGLPYLVLLGHDVSICGGGRFREEGSRLTGSGGGTEAERKKLDGGDVNCQPRSALTNGAR
jgi:hypothetical protein